MENHRYLRKISSIEYYANKYLNKVVVFFILVAFLFTACTKKMSLDEAKRTTAAMRQVSFVPPPRRVDDILLILNQPGKFAPKITEEIKSKVDALPPETTDPAILARFYSDRGYAANQFGLYGQALMDARLSLHYAEKAGMSGFNLAFILFRLGIVEEQYGSFSQAVAILKRSLAIHKISSVYSELVRIYVNIGDFKKAQEIADEGIRHASRPVNSEEARFWNRYEMNHMKFRILEAQQRFAKAEPYIRSMIVMVYEEKREEMPGLLLWQRYKLSRNLYLQGRLAEAEIEVRETLKEAIAFSGEVSGITGDLLEAFTEILLAQGRLREAEQIALARIRIIKKIGISSDSFNMGIARSFLADILTARQDYSGAVKQYKLAQKMLMGNRYVYDRILARNPNFMLSLLKQGHVEEALKNISSVYTQYMKFLGDEHYLTAEVLGLRGIGYTIVGETTRAINDFKVSIPILITEKSNYSHDSLKKKRLKIVLETYLNLLTDIYEAGREMELGVSLSAESFKLMQAAGESSLLAAMVQSGVRASVLDEDLAALVRKEQDTFKQLNFLYTALTNVLAAPLEQQDPEAIQDLKESSDRLNQARDSLLREINRRFPKYADYSSPDPLEISSVQEQLRSGESMVAIYPTEKQTYVWAIPTSGGFAFHVAKIGSRDLADIVAHLRHALSPQLDTFGDIPEFDLDRAHALYSKLLEPIKGGWQSATDLLIIAHGSLSQLPSSVLPTSPVRLVKEKAVLFSRYQQVPWLIRKVSITRLPSVSSLITLRELPEGDPNRKAFAGFGDPFFSQEQFARAQRDKGGHEITLASRGRKVRLRGIRVTQAGNLDSQTITSSNLGLLNRLPDTAEEIRGIATALDANPVEDIFLGKNASEHLVKRMNLSDRRVIAFATHALLPGDLDGLNQPALALCSPKITGENEDGLLTMGEIMQLKLNADWIVLSACNTGAADGAGAEAVTGLGRAFFYAGTRAILVSMWPVETTSAKRLTTGLFRHQKEDPNLSRARALRKSMLELIDGPGLRDETTGKIVASYAHPIFWAPFIIVGESGVGAN